MNTWGKQQAQSRDNFELVSNKHGIQTSFVCATELPLGWSMTLSSKQAPENRCANCLLDTNDDWQYPHKLWYEHVAVKSTILQILMPSNFGGTQTIKFVSMVAPIARTWGLQSMIVVAILSNIVGAISKVVFHLVEVSLRDDEYVCCNLRRCRTAGLDTSERAKISSLKRAYASVPDCTWHNRHIVICSFTL